jgi:hypothetical protein
MKIIAKTESGYLVDASENEIAQLHGYEGHYDSDYRKAVSNAVPGAEIDISKIVKAAKYVRTLDSAVLEQSHDRLLTMADKLSEVRDLVYKLNMFEDLKKQSDEPGMLA